MEHKDWIALIVMVGIISIFATIFTFFGFQQGMQKITGHATGVTNVTVYTTTSLTMIISNVYLGNLTIGDTNGSDTNEQGDGFQIQNDGNVLLNVSMSATSLFTATPNPTSNYLFIVSDAGEGGINTTTWGEETINTTYTNVPGTSTLIITYLNETDASDLAEIDINITVPTAETAGLKTSTVTFTAVDAIST